MSCTVKAGQLPTDFRMLSLPEKQNASTGLLEPASFLATQPVATGNYFDLFALGSVASAVHWGITKLQPGSNQPLKPNPN